MELTDEAAYSRFTLFFLRVLGDARWREIDRGERGAFISRATRGAASTRAGDPFRRFRSASRQGRGLFIAIIRAALCHGLTVRARMRARFRRMQL